MVALPVARTRRFYELAGWRREGQQRPAFGGSRGALEIRYERDLETRATVLTPGRSRRPRLALATTGGSPRMTRMALLCRNPSAASGQDFVATGGEGLRRSPPVRSPNDALTPCTVVESSGIPADGVGGDAAGVIP